MSKKKKMKQKAKWERKEEAKIICTAFFSVAPIGQKVTADGVGVR